MIDPKSLLEGTTPGPWKEWHGDIIADGDRSTDFDDYVVAGIGTSCGLRSSPFCPVRTRQAAGHANARLIAAAPDLARDNIAKGEEIERLRAALELVAAPMGDPPEQLDGFNPAVSLEWWGKKAIEARQIARKALNREAQS